MDRLRPDVREVQRVHGHGQALQPVQQPELEPGVCLEVQIRSRPISRDYRCDHRSYKNKVQKLGFLFLYYDRVDNLEKLDLIEFVLLAFHVVLHIKKKFRSKKIVETHKE